MESCLKAELKSTSNQSTNELLVRSIQLTMTLKVDHKYWWELEKLCNFDLDLFYAPDFLFFGSLCSWSKVNMIKFDDSQWY